MLNITQRRSNIYLVIFLVGKNKLFSEYRGTFFYYLALIKSRSNEVENVEKSKEVTLETWKLRSRNFSMASEKFSWTMDYWYYYD